jgi:hypothetical protein
MFRLFLHYKLRKKIMDKSIYEAHKTQSYTTITIKIKIMNLESLQNLKIMISLILYNFIFFI